MAVDDSSGGADLLAALAAAERITAVGECDCIASAETFDCGYRTAKTGSSQQVIAATADYCLACDGWPDLEARTSPFTEDQAPLVIALDVSSSMEMTDIQPSRLQRAQQKVRDLLAERSGARTALLAYAGSAHMVLPLTDDPNILEMYVEALSPAIMPEQGKDAAKALDLAQEMLAKEEVPGTILFLTDGISKESASGFC